MLENKVIWFTGLSGSGKSTIADELIKMVPDSVILDGDVFRDGLCKDLGFSIEDRNENIRRAAEVTKILYNSGKNVIASFISPIEKDREYARSLINERDFNLVHLSTSLEECEKRDVKGLYKKARDGLIPEFTGIDSPFEKPSEYELEFDTEDEDLAPKDVAEKIYKNVFNNDFSKVPHDTFIGRWCPFHKGHFAIMKETYEKNKNPLLVLVRDTKFDKYPAEYRKQMVEYSLNHMDIPSTVKIIPDIDSVNWGRGVGYGTNLVEVSENIKGISATEIRNLMDLGDNSWRNIVCDGVAEFIDKNGL
ncbi:TPA: adenylyl-sulfate kinase [Candidatus Pacearchaeota archaeon]|nr:adenylyl-sulfate kinase [Candidatus Pacearchaeota archaeon]